MEGFDLPPQLSQEWFSQHSGFTPRTNLKSPILFTKVNHELAGPCARPESAEKTKPCQSRAQ
jgi:hypothetical protein